MRRLSNPSLGALLVLAVQVVPAGAQVGTVMVRGRPDTVADSSKMVRLRLTLQKVDSLVRLQNELTIGSPEYRRIDDELRAMTEMLLPTRATTLNRDGNVVIVEPRVVAGMPRGTFFLPQMIGDLVPRGWLGLRLDGYSKADYQPVGQIVRYYQVPTVISIDANSPASKVGIQVGDSVLAFDGLDVRDHTNNLTRLLEPSHRLTMKVRQDGETKDFAVVVTVAPPELMTQRLAEANVVAMPSRAPMAKFDTSVDARRTQEVFAQNRLVAGARAPSPAMRVNGGSIMAATKMPDAITGAKLTNLTPELAAALSNDKVLHGVFVADVLPGTDAERIGFRKKDVIITIGDADVVSIAQINREVYATGSSRPTVFIVLRGGKMEKLTYEPR